MSLHTIAFVSNPDLSPTEKASLLAGNGLEKTMIPVPDPAMSSAEAQGVFIPAGMHIVAAYTSGWATFSAGGNDQNPVEWCQLRAPSLLQIAQPMIRPVAQRPGDNLPGLQMLVDHPIALGANEVLQAVVNFKLGAPITGAVTIDSLFAVTIVLLSDHIVLPPVDGQVYWIGGEFTGTPTAGQWSALSWPAGAGGKLPDGKYALLAMEHLSESALACRVSFPGAVYRPGVISVQQRFFRTNDAFYQAKFGVYGVFSPFAPPTFEVLCGGGAMPTVHQIYFAVMKIA